MKNPASYLSTHLLTILTICFIVGIWCSPHLQQHFDIGSPATIIFLLLVVVAGIFFLRGRAYQAQILLTICTLLVGYLHGLAHFQTPDFDQHIYNLIQNKSEVILTGHLKQMVSYNGKMSQAVIELRSIRRQGTKFHQPANGLVRLSLKGRWPKKITPGDRIVVRAEIKRPRSFHTPGIFDYARFLAQKDIWVTGYIRSPLFIKELANDPSFSGKYKYLPEKLRTHIGNYLDQNLAPPFASIYRALILGDRSNVPPAILELFKATGTFHILAISGIHMAVIATLLYLIFYWLLSRSEYLLLHFSVRKIVACLSIPILSGYALLAGMNSPVTRAVIMSIIVLLALCTDRKKSPAPLVATAAFIILVFDPQQLFSVSFQLSFTAVSGILFILPILQKHIFKEQEPEQKQTRGIDKLYKYILSALLVSVTATLVTAPITLSTFNRISTIGPLANLIIEPLICLWCLPAGIIALPLLWLSPETANIFLHFGSYGISTALYASQLLAKLPFASVYLATPPLHYVLLYYFTLFLCVRHFMLKPKKTTALLLAPLLIAIALFVNNYRTSPNRQIARVTYIDVGQGSATLLESGDHTILIDGGGSSFSSRNVGETVIAPFLWNKGITTVKTIIITHPDADHYNGLEYIVKHFSPAIVWVRDLRGHDRKYRKFISDTREKGIEIKVPGIGDILLETELTLQCLANLKGKAFKNTRSGLSANTGLIIKGCFGEYCFLFPGDINISMEQFLLAQYLSLEADTLLSAHHGSKTSNSEEFLATVSPRYTVVSAGTSTKGHFPHQSFLDTCKALNIETFITAKDGSIEFEVNKTSTTVRTTVRFQQNPLYPLVFSTQDPGSKVIEQDRPE